jgi:hypothetical protein
MSTLNDIMHEVYYNPSKGYSSFRALWKRVNDMGVRVTQKQTKEFIAKQRVAQLYKPAHKKKQTVPYVVQSPRELYSIDLADLNKYKYQGWRYMFVGIDGYTKMAHVKPLKRKDGDEVMVGLIEMISKFGRPLKIVADNEFGTRALKAYCKASNIILKLVNPYSHSNMLVERFIRTLKEKLVKVMEETGQKNWNKLIPQVLHNYHTTEHSAYGIAPVNVARSNARETIFRKLSKRRREPVKFRVGDNVRLSVEKDQFEKGYTVRWTREVYVVSKVHEGIVPTYSIMDKKGEKIKGMFYSNELQKV